MPYFLRHHFDPDFDYQNLKPRERADGRVDHYNMGYVQNVARGQVLAEWVASEDEAGECSVPVTFEHKTFPAGMNTEVDPENPDRLLAAAPGYVFYDQGLICVKKTLNVRRDVDFHTGNIQFLGNVVVHGGVRSGFEVRALNVLAKDTVDAARVRADKSVLAEAGIKGGGKGVVHAGENLRTPFAENAMLLAGSRMLIDVACMHCDLFAGEQLAVKGRLAGGVAVSSRLIYVGEKLGGGLGAETVLVLGYDAMLMNRSRLVESRIKVCFDRLQEIRSQLAAHPELAHELEPKIKDDREQLVKLREVRADIWKRIHAVEDLESCRVVVPGKVLPGVEVSIGGASLVVDDYLEDVRFVYRDQEIKIQSPAMKR
ncbi:FapA family protein [Desulfocurvus sp. DL9XJH121]